MRSNNFARRVAGPLALAAALIIAAPAAAQTGGTSGTTTTTTTTPTQTTPTPTGPPGKARVTKKGFAIPPANAPPAVVAAITAGNQIRKTPYRWGGGHATFFDSGYDCSGAVSYVLHAAGLLTSPLPSGPLMTWGLPGRGRWITVFANKGHTYAKIAGLRWDTSAAGSGGGKGPRWRVGKRKARGYAIRHYDGY
jgi:hypothetical protein